MCSTREFNMLEAAIAVMAFALAASAIVYAAAHVANGLDDGPTRRTADDQFEVYAASELYR